MATNEELIWQYLKSQGFSDAGAAGLMGNLYAESGLKSTNLQNTYERKLGYTDDQYTKAVDDGSYDNFVRDSAGYGLAQWTYWSRKQNLLNFAKQKNKSIGDLYMQLDFLMTELSSGYKGLLQTLKSTKSVKEASNGVLLQFERPADQSVSVQNKRASYGQTYYDKYAQKTVQPTGGSKMKYNEKNKPLVCMMKNSTCYKQTRTMTPVGVLWHSTGANNPNLKRYVQPYETDANYNELVKIIGKNTNKNDWNHIYHQAGLNCWVGKLANGEVSTVQTMPWNYRPWGCGSGSKGSCNNGWIQFEICEDGLNDKNYFDKVYKEACEITAYLCKMYNLNPHGTVKMNGVNVPVILCHADSYKLGFGGNHGADKLIERCPCRERRLSLRSQIAVGIENFCGQPRIQLVECRESAVSQASIFINLVERLLQRFISRRRIVGRFSVFICRGRICFFPCGIATENQREIIIKVKKCLFALSQCFACLYSKLNCLRTVSQSVNKVADCRLILARCHLAIHHGFCDSTQSSFGFRYLALGNVIVYKPAGLRDVLFLIPFHPR